MPENQKVRYIKISSDYYRDFCDEFNSIAEENRHLHEEIRYLEAFIEWKKLSAEFVYFKENAYDKYDEFLPFPTLTINKNTDE